MSLIAFIMALLKILSTPAFIGKFVLLLTKMLATLGQ